MLGDRDGIVARHANQWTSIACLLWDDASPAALEPAQQQAMLDWLHWGGQLILSGPDTLDALRDSFLGPLFAGDFRGHPQTGRGGLAELNAFSGKPIRPLRPVRPWSGVRLEKASPGRVHARRGPVARRAAGRARADRGLGLSTLRPRVRSTGPAATKSSTPFCSAARRASTSKAKDGGLAAPVGRRRSSARRRPRPRNCAISPATRASRLAEYAADAITATPTSADYDANAVRPIRRRRRGVAAWNDFNPVAAAARESLQNAARVEIPKRSFVLWVVAVYVLVLVPVNWAVFRALGRVEWAWAAAPVIAVVCTGAVIRLAQLDIGFVRSQTEVAVAEMQGDYRPRPPHPLQRPVHLAGHELQLSGATIPAGWCCRFRPLPGRSCSACRWASRLRKLTFRRGEQAALPGLSRRIELDRPGPQRRDVRLRRRNLAGGKSMGPAGW